MHLRIFHFSWLLCGLLGCKGDGKASGDSVDAEPMYPWGWGLDHDGDGERTYLLGGKDIDDSDPLVTISQGDGTFELSSTLETHDRDCTPTAVSLGDFNEDSKTDFIVNCQGGGLNDEGLIEVWFGAGDGTFEYSSAVDMPQSGLAAVGDYNQDGHLDIFHYGKLMLGVGDGTFVPGTEPPTHEDSQPYRSYALDMNNDDFLDIVGVNYGKCIAIYLGNGTDEFTLECIEHVNLQDLAFGFLNDDDKIDIVVTAYDSTSPYNNYTLAVYINDFSEGTLAAGEVSDAVEYHADPEMGDVNNDGYDDVIERNFLAGEVNIFLSNGSDAVGILDNDMYQPSSSLAGIKPDTMAVVDVNGDGYRDLLGRVFIRNFETI